MGSPLQHQLMSNPVPPLRILSCGKVRFSQRKTWKHWLWQLIRTLSQKVQATLLVEFQAILLVEFGRINERAKRPSSFEGHGVVEEDFQIDFVPQ